MGLINHHPNKKRVKPVKPLTQTKTCVYFIYSVFRGILMFPYIILFFPFMILLLLPGIFSYSYYLYIFDAYITSVLPGDAPLVNVGDN